VEVGEGRIARIGQQPRAHLEVDGHADVARWQGEGRRRDLRLDEAADAGTLAGRDRVARDGDVVDAEAHAVDVHGVRHLAVLGGEHEIDAGQAELDDRVELAAQARHG
jgi:hypothetical protein